MELLRPSNIRQRILFASSQFHNIEKEAVSAFIVTFLAAHGDDWNQEFVALEFVQWLTSDAPVNDLYRFTRDLFAEGLINAIHELIGDDYIKRRDADDTMMFRVTDRYIEFFRQYAA
jgi:hypothetical protein